MSNVVAFPTPDDFAGKLARVKRRNERIVAPYQLDSTAAAVRLDPSSAVDVKSTASNREPWQSAAWGVYDEIAEVRRAGNFMADAISRLRWFVGVRTEPDGPVLPLDATVEMDDPRGGDPTEVEVVDAPTRMAVQDAFGRLRAPDQTINDLMRDAELQVFQAGEGFLVGREVPAEIVDGQELYPAHERFDVLSIDELEADGTHYAIRSHPAARQGGGPGLTYVSPSSADSKPQRVPDDAFVMRFWRRHPRYGEMADAALRSLMVECEELRVLTRSIMASAMSRMSAGVLILPKEATSHVGGADTPGAKKSNASRIGTEMAQQLASPTQDPGSAAAVAPFVLEIAGEYIDKVKHLTFDRNTAEDRATRDELIRRILTGLPVPIENITGLGETSTYANARIVTEQTFDQYVAPDATLLSNCWTVGFLIPELRARGIDDPSRFTIWYDPTGLIGKPGLEDNAIVAHDKILISDATARRALGFSEEDAPSEEEAAERMERKSAMAPQPFGGSDTNPNAEDQIVDTADAEASIASLALTAAVTNADADRLSRRIARIDDDLRAKVHTYLGALVERAIEKAGAKARNKARGDDAMTAAISTVDNLQVCAQLGPSWTAALGIEEEDILDEVLAGGAATVLAYIETAQNEALVAARRYGVDDATIDTVKARQADDREAGWALLLAAVLVVARVRLFDPRPAQPELGEWDGGNPIPPGPIRAGLSRAGGSTGTLVESAIGPGLPKVPAAVIEADGSVAGGVASGPTTLEVYRGLGFVKAGYQWSVGAPAVPFEPHQALDGVVFETWDDPVLANPGDWPAEAYFRPADHLGCQCEATLLLRTTEEVI